MRNNAGPVRAQEQIDPAAVGATEVLATPLETPHPYPAGNGSGLPVWSGMLDLGAQGCSGCSTAVWTKLHFSQFQLGPGDYVQVQDLAGTWVDRYDSTEPADFWALSVPGNVAVVQLFADARSSSAAGDFGFVIDRAGYGFADLLSIPQGVCDFLTAGLLCDPPPDDAVCHPAEYPDSFPVGRLIYGTGDLCWAVGTGFIVNEEGDVMTCEHVVGSQLDVLSAEMQFRYENPLCGVPITNPLYHITPGLRFRGKQLLEGDYDCDVAVFSLLFGSLAAQLHGIVPAAVANPSAPDAIWIPQHPTAKPKKIDHGTVLSVGMADLAHEEGEPARACAGDVLVMEAQVGAGSSGSPVIDLATGELVGTAQGGAESGSTCLVAGPSIEAIRDVAGAYLQDGGWLTRNILFEDELTGSFADEHEVELAISCLSFLKAESEVSSDWSLLGRFPARLTLRWDPDEAVSGAGYAGCPPFQVHVAVELYDDPDARELELEFQDFYLRREFSRSACGFFGTEWGFEVERDVLIQSDVNPTLSGIVANAKGTTVEIDSATMDILFLNILEATSLLDLPGLSVAGTEVAGTAYIEDVQNVVPPNGGVSFATSSQPIHCGQGDDVQESLCVLHEFQLATFDVSIKPCVLPGSSFTFRFDPERYGTIPTVDVGLRINLFMNAALKVLSVLCPPCTGFLPSLWDVPHTTGGDDLEFEVVVQPPTPQDCDAAAALLDTFCQIVPNDPLCLAPQASTDQGLDLALEIEALGSLPPGLPAASALQAVDVDYDMLPEAVHVDPLVQLHAPTPGTKALLQLRLRDVYGRVPDLAAAVANGAWDLELRLFTPGGPAAGAPLAIAGGWVDGIPLQPGQLPSGSGKILFDPMLAVAFPFGTFPADVIVVEWDVPPVTDAIWGLGAGGKLACSPSSYVQAKLVPVSVSVPEFTGNNTVQQPFTPGFPDFVFETVGTVRDGNLFLYPNEEHRWLQVSKSVTIEFTVSDRGSGGGSFPQLGQVPVYLTVQYVDEDGVLPVYTDTAAAVPITIPATAFGAGASATGRFHYDAPPAALVDPQEYDTVVFTLTINDVPSCEVLTGAPPCGCDSPGTGAQSPCSCTQDPLTGAFQCGTLPAAWGGGPAVLLPECDRSNNVARLRLEYRPKRQPPHRGR